MTQPGLERALVGLVRQALCEGRALTTARWAATAEDVLRRRTTVSIRGRSTDDVRGRVERLLAPLSATEHRARS